MFMCSSKNPTPSAREFEITHIQTILKTRAAGSLKTMMTGRVGLKCMYQTALPRMVGGAIVDEGFDTILNIGFDRKFDVLWVGYPMHVASGYKPCAGGPTFGGL
uniref:Peptidase A1 domain-containing protein n=1 Tax=Panagrellus redivivus TaxID=6233 RepID=A0A7E4ZRZ9_PANRE